MENANMNSKIIRWYGTFLNSMENCIHARMVFDIYTCKSKYETDYKKFEWDFFQKTQIVSNNSRF